MAVQLTQTLIKQVQDSIDWIIGKESTGGIKVDVDTPDYPWHDIIGDVIVHDKTIGAPPALVQYNGTGIYQFQFVVGKAVYHMFHVPHDYALGSDVYIHAHWSHDTAPLDNVVQWSFDAMWAKRDGSFGSIVTAIASDTAGTSALVHHVDEAQLTGAVPSGSLIDSALLEVDGIFLVKTELTSNVSGQNPFLHTVDLHYQSTGVGTKNKISPFYT